MARNPAVLLVTAFPFWALGDGQRMRLLALVWVLGQRADLTVLYLGTASPEDVQRLRSLRVKCDFRALSVPGGRESHLDAVRSLCAAKRFDFCIVERLPLDYVRGALPQGVRTVLDTHDLLSEHSNSRSALGLSASGYSLDRELAVLGAYDCVLTIQAEEHALVAPRLSNRVILAPHPVVFPRRPVRPEGRTLGLVASRYEANLHGLDWLADAVRPLIGERRAELHLFGWIGDVWRPDAYPEFVRHGFVPDFNRVWGEIDVAINPVRWGSGLKIKNVEALGNGLPLVTTAEGARGISDAAGEAFLLADEPAAFADACERLLGDAVLRERLGASAYAYARRHFSPETCFGELLRWLGE